MSSADLVEYYYAQPIEERIYYSDLSNDEIRELKCSKDVMAVAESERRSRWYYARY